jgi:hypothetical protein
MQLIFLKLQLNYKNGIMLLDKENIKMFKYCLKK